MTIRTWVAIYDNMVFYPQKLSSIFADMRPTWSKEILNVGTQETPICLQVASFNIGSLPAGVIEQSTVANPISQMRLENVNLLNKPIWGLHITQDGVYCRRAMAAKALESGKLRSASYFPFAGLTLSKKGKPFLVVGDYLIREAMDYAAYTDAFEDKQTIDKVLVRLCQPKTVVRELADLIELAKAPLIG